jgi:hypothetical protein
MAEPPVEPRHRFQSLEREEQSLGYAILGAGYEFCSVSKLRIIAFEGDDMTKITVTAHVGEDRRLVLDLPENVSPGTHRVTVTLEPGSDRPTARISPFSEQPGLEWEGDLLVFTGELLEDPNDVLQRLREERLDHLSRVSGISTDATR